MTAAPATTGAFGELVSGEGVRLDLVRAGIASRTLAALIDAGIQFGALLLLTLGTVAAASDDTAALTAAIVAEVVLVIAGYPIVLEWTTRGRTVGKIALGLRVARDDGGPIGFRQALVRGLSSLILEKPGVLFPISTAAGVITLTVSREQKRIGDYLAGTVVVDERAAPQPLAVPPPWVAPPLMGWAQSVDLLRLDDATALRVRQFIARAYALTPAARAELGRRLYEHVLTLVSPPPPPNAPVSEVLVAVLAERRRRAQFGSPPVAHTPSPRPRPRAPEPGTGFVAPG